MADYAPPTQHLAEIIQATFMRYNQGHHSEERNQMTIPTLDPYALRAQFPALQRTVDDRPAVYLDGPGGTQTPERVIEAMTDIMRSGSSNHGGLFQTSRETDAATEEARLAMMDMLNARRPEEIIFGQNMT